MPDAGCYCFILTTNIFIHWSLLDAPLLLTWLTQIEWHVRRTLDR
jgi:hypothetical protein